MAAYQAVRFSVFAFAIVNVNDRSGTGPTHRRTLF